MAGIDLMKAYALVLIVGCALAFAVLATPPVAPEAAAHPTWTCTHTSAGHWTWGKRHEVRYIRGWSYGSRHYHRYSYYTWSLTTSWVFHYRLTRDCTGAR